MSLQAKTKPSPLSKKSRGLPLRWVQHLNVSENDDKDRSDFANVLYNSTPVLARLVDMLFDDLNRVTRTELSIDDFEDTNWSHKQAYRNGYKKAIMDYLALTEGVLNSDPS